MKSGFCTLKKEFQKQGLAKWLKAHALLDMKKMFPELKAIETGNEETNASMLSINQRLGFKVKMDWLMYSIPI